MSSSILILNDGRVGHLNQSVALAKYLDMPYDVVEVLPKYSWSKTLTYVLDKFGVKTKFMFHDIALAHDTYSMIIGTGSWTYYMVKVIAEQLHSKSVVMMLPKGYRYDFDVIFAQKHDNPPVQDNIVEVPVNFTYVEPQGLYISKKESIGIIIGGDNKIFRMSKEKVKEQLDFIKKYYEDFEIAVTTSPRTSKIIEDLVQSYNFDYEVIFSQNRVNPIPDFLEQCNTVFITGDSTSMISEAITYGRANVIVLPLESRGENKFIRFVKTLEKDGYLHLFNGTLENKNRKIDFKMYLQRVKS